MPVTKRDKSISKIKLPGFENNVWVPTQTKKIVGIVNQVRPYTTIFAVVNTPISLFNVEVLRQTLDDRVKFLNLTGRDVLKMVHVPFTTPAKSSVTTLDNAAVELADAENAEVDDDAETETDNASITDEEPGVAGEQENLAAGEEKPEAILEPDPEPRRIDMKARVETTRYLLLRTHRSLSVHPQFHYLSQDFHIRWNMNQVVTQSSCDATHLHPILFHSCKV